MNTHQRQPQAVRRTDDSPADLPWRPARVDVIAAWVISVPILAFVLWGNALAVWYVAVASWEDLGRMLVALAGLSLFALPFVILEGVFKQATTSNREEADRE